MTRPNPVLATGAPQPRSILLLDDAPGHPSFADRRFDLAETTQRLDATAEARVYEVLTLRVVRTWRDETVTAILRREVAEISA